MSREIDGPLRVVSADWCHAASDGECRWTACPQLRDREPEASGRHCPLDADSEDQ